ncbi:glycosyltransferase family 4 protein [Planomonospora sp. ID82291]|uniref:glycosyltransferase family 4 protein n=1 Tax=Planomonospora sp. ID82291 TaxID=2738136 RepID=UPI0018C3994A|nr:glycosyltransferase family 4 protein [Planomonospora sp. ID82291]MBG0812648.1 glycosyltransferase family 4 protein [Planomonospora sp. ID82291]
MRIHYVLLHAYGMGGTIRTVFSQANAMAAAGHDVEIASVIRRRDTPQFPLDPRVALTALVDQRDGAAPPDSVARRVWRRLRGRIVPRGEFAAHYFTERVEKAAIDYVSSVSGGVLVTTRPALNLVSARRGPRGVVRIAQEHMNLATHPATVRAEIARHYGRLDALAVLTGTDRRDYQRLLPGTPVVRIPNAVADLGGRRPTTHENRLVVAAGRLTAQKGFDLLIRAFAQVAERHPGWRLRIYGSGAKKAELRRLVTRLGLDGTVALMGRSDHLPDHLAEASVYALSSRFEGLPMVMIEAMGHGLPVVAFDCPTGPGEVLTDGVDGLLVPPGDVGALAAGIGRLIADEELRRRLGAAARETVRDYAPDAVMPLWENLFAGFLGAGVTR